MRKKIKTMSIFSLFIIGLVIGNIGTLVQSGPFLLDPGPGGGGGDSLPPVPNWVQKRYWKVDLASYSIFTELPSENSYRLRMQIWESFDTENEVFKMHYKIELYYWMTTVNSENEALYPHLRVRQLSLTYSTWTGLNTIEDCVFITDGNLERYSLVLDSDYYHAGSNTFGTIELGLEMVIFSAGGTDLLGGTFVFHPNLVPKPEDYWPNDSPEGVSASTIPEVYLGYNNARDQGFDKYFCFFTQFYTQPAGSIVLPANAWFFSGANIFVN